MHPFEENEQEPVAVVRTLSDFALALTLVVLMLIGSRSVAASKQSAKAKASEAQIGAQASDLNLLLLDGGMFQVVGEGSRLDARRAAPLAEAWTKRHPRSPAAIVVQFAPKTLATDLHKGLLELQSAFGTNLARIETVPQP